MAQPTSTGLPDPQMLEKLNTLSATFGRSISKALGDAALHGRSLDDTLKSTLKSFEQLAMKAAMQPLQQGLLTVLKTMLGGIGTALTGSALPSSLAALFGPSAAGGGLPVVPHALGGVLDGPSLFPMGDRVGLAGEAGPEAVLPLARGADGRLGVRSTAGRPVSVIVNIATPDAESFRRSQAQVAGALARAVARGQRAT